MRLAVLLMFILAGASAAPSPVAAHAPGQSYIFLRFYDDSIAVRLEITAADLDRVAGLRSSGGRTLSHEDISSRLDAILGYVRPRLRIGAGGRELPLRFSGHDVRNIEIADYVLLHFTIDGIGQVPRRLDVAFPVLFEVDDTHRNLLVVEHDWKSGTLNNESRVSLIFSPASPRQELDLAAPSLLRGLVGFIKLGIHHIWIGIDHILFLLALMLPAVMRRQADRWEPVSSFRPALLNVVAIITFFTIAHTITLSLAALGIFRLPERLVEAAIAASIAAAALYNLYPRLQVREWLIAFGFGLFHGFGFANVLTAIGLERNYLALSLLGFNLGVEVGQVAIICAVFPAFFLLRARPVYRPMLRYASIAMILIAAFWFVERAFDLPLTRQAQPALDAAQQWLAGR